MEDESLIAAAKAVKERAYAPYSSFYVGAAVLDEAGRVHSGCNVENAAYPEGFCAEANAIGSMVAAGGKRVLHIAIVGGAAGPAGLQPCTPCGGCRQRILEFADADTRILLLDASGQFQHHTMDDLLPLSFRF